MSVKTLSQQKLSTQIYNKNKIMPKGSAYFDGSGDYLTLATNSVLNMSTGNFTIEWWWKPTAISSYVTPLDKGFTGSGGLILQAPSNGGKMSCYVAGTTIFTSSSAIPTNTWTHFALVRNSGTITLYQGGASVGSASNSTDFTNSSTLYIGCDSSTATNTQFTGWMSNYRIVKGTAVYTSAFTPPTTPLTAISGTSLLTCHRADSIFDGSLNNLSVTAVGNTVASSESPF